MVVCLLAAFAALGGVGTAQSAISSAEGAYGKKVTICHKGKTISISKSAWPAHQRHGDTLGTCASAAAKAKKAKAAKIKAAKAKAEAAKAKAEKAKSDKKQDDPSDKPGKATARAAKARSPHSYDAARGPATRASRFAAQSRWQLGQYHVPRPATRIFSSGVPQRSHGSPVRP